MSSKRFIVHINEHTARLVRLVDNRIEHHVLVTFSDKTDRGIRDQLSMELDKEEFRVNDWTDFTLSWFTHHSTLLPFSIFEESSPKKVYELSFGEMDPNREIVYDRVPACKLVNIYSIPKAIKKLFIARFPRIIIQHEGSNLIRGLEDFNSKEINLAICQHQNYCLVAAMKQNQLLHYNAFDYQNFDDIVFHLANVIQKNDWINEPTSWIYTNNQEDNESFKKLSKLKNQFNIFEKSDWKMLDNWLTKTQLLCV